jgi:hypothetical protein
MLVSRRKFLRLTLGVGLLASSGYILKDIFLPSQLDIAERRTFTAFLDTLIPSDETPGALKLGVAEKILNKASQDAQYRRLIRKGCAWLDRKARGRGGAGYSSLDEGNREVVMGELVGVAAVSVPGIFFEQMRSDALFHYYAHPASWRGLGYKGPDYTEQQPFVS